MITWKTYKLGELALQKKKSVISGPFGSNISSKFFVPEGIPVIRGNNLTGNLIKFVDDGFVFITEEKAKELNCWAIKDDLLFTAAGTIGQVGLLTGKEKYKKYVISNKQIRVTLDKSLIEPLFAFYWFSQPQMVNYIMNQNTGSTIPLINLSVVKSLPINLPELPTQQRIAEILSALDDKIELNRRTNQTLEQMTQSLFRQNFIDGIYEENLPTGWREGKLGDIVDVKGGTTPSTKQREFWEGSIHWTSPKDLSSVRFPVLLETEKKITEAGLKKISSGLLPVGTLLLSSRAPIGYLAITQIPVAINQGYIAIICGKGYSNYFMLYWLKEYMNIIIQNANGSTFLEISKSAFKNVDLNIPPVEQVKEFDNKVEALFQKLILNEQESAKLKTLRDTLLPKLMSGEIDVMQTKQEALHEQVLS